ncbi:MAG: protein disulfide oxidoreductase [Thermoproteota archaeon]
MTDGRGIMSEERLLSKEDAEYLRQRFKEEMDKPVRIVVFIKEVGCRYCKETVMIAKEVSDLDDRISLYVYKIDENKDKATAYSVDKVPATIIVGSDVYYKIRFFGIPSGHEFATYIEDIINVSRRDPNLNPRTVEKIKKIDKETHIQVFVTPTCPYCPRMVLMAHQFAMVNPLIKSDMVEAIEFPRLSQKYNVMGVPRTIVNEVNAVVGLIPEPLFVEFLYYSVGLISQPSERLQQVLRQTEMEAEQVDYAEPEHEHSDEEES